MARYFAGNTLASFRRYTSDTVESANASSFDAAYVSNSILVPNFASIATPVLSAAGPTVWFRMTRWGGAIIYSNLTPIEVFNSTTSIFRIRQNSSVWFAERWNGSAWAATGSNFTVPLGTSAKTIITVRLDLGSGFSVYSNGVLVATGSGWTGSPTTPVSALHIRACGDEYFSEVMMADYDLRDSHYMCKRPAGNGSYADGTGTFADVDDLPLDDINTIILPATGTRKVFTHSGITVPNGYKISAASVGVRGRVAGGLTDGKALLRSGSTDSASTVLGLSTGFEARNRLFETDPATGAAFTQAGFNALQFGLEAV